MLIVFLLIFCVLSFWLILWIRKDRKYESSLSVASAYDNWTNDQLLEKLWGDHIHLGFYEEGDFGKDFRQAKIDFVHELIRWSGMDQLPKGSRILDVGCGIGGSARILADDYGFDVLGVSISQAQIKRANELTPNKSSCRFEIMDALELKFGKGCFDGVWSIEAGPHILDKQRYADEMLRVLRPGGVLCVADWNIRDQVNGKELNKLERLVIKQLLDQWAHPKFSSINGFKRNLLNSYYCGGNVETEDWTAYTLPSWIDSILEGFRRHSSVLELGPRSLIIGLREIPTLILMHWAFANGLMQFGIFRTRG